MNKIQILGLATGIIFGFLLQKGRVVRFDKQINALLFKDMDILKFMLTAIGVGMVGITVLSQSGVIALSHKAFNVGGVVVGAILFGIGWAITGLCPGTAVGALGEGRLHAVFPILGMFAGAGLYAHSYDFMREHLLSIKNYGKISLSDVTGIPHAYIMLGFLAMFLVLFYIFEKKKL